MMHSELQMKKTWQFSENFLALLKPIVLFLIPSERKWAARYRNDLTCLETNCQDWKSTESCPTNVYQEKNINAAEKKF